MDLEFEEDSGARRRSGDSSMKSSHRSFRKERSADVQNYLENYSILAERKRIFFTVKVKNIVGKIQTARINRDSAAIAFVTRLAVGKRVGKTDFADTSRRNLVIRS